jgi:hypothetical protein
MSDSAGGGNPRPVKATRPGGGKQPGSWGGKGADPWGGKGARPWNGKGEAPWNGKGTAPWGGKGPAPWGGGSADPWGGTGERPWSSRYAGVHGDTVTVVLDRRTAENVYYALALALGGVDWPEATEGWSGTTGKGNGKTHGKGSPKDAWAGYHRKKDHGPKDHVPGRTSRG